MTLELKILKKMKELDDDSSKMLRENPDEYEKAYAEGMQRVLEEIRSIYDKIQ